MRTTRVISESDSDSFNRKIEAYEKDGYAVLGDVVYMPDGKIICTLGKEVRKPE